MTISPTASLDKLGVRVLAEDAGQATVLVDGEQLETLARLRFEPQARDELGALVAAHAELIAVDGRRLTFRVSAHDGTEPIGEGTHERALIDLARFEAKVAAKAAQAGQE